MNRLGRFLRRSTPLVLALGYLAVLPTPAAADDPTALSKENAAMFVTDKARKELSPRQLKEQAHRDFSDVKKTFGDNPTDAQILDVGQREFDAMWDKKSAGSPQKKQYSDQEVAAIKQVVTDRIKAAEQYLAIFRNGKPDKEQFAEARALALKLKGDAPPPAPPYKPSDMAGWAMIKAMDLVADGLVPQQGRGTLFPSPGDLFGGLSGIQDPDSAAVASQDDRFKGDGSAALADASRAVNLGGGADALALRGSIELDQAQYSRAYQDARQALQLDAANKEALTIAHFSQGRIDGVSTNGEPAARAQGSDFNAAASAGNVVPKEGTGEDGALPGGLARAATVSASSQLLGEQARGALALNDLPGATAQVNRALSLDPRNPALYGLRAAVYAREHNYRASAQDAQTGLALAPDDPMLLRELGYARLRGGDFRGALESANDLIERRPQDPYAYALRAHAYGNMGDREAMLADIGRAASLDGRFQSAAQAVQRLQLPTDKDILFLFPGEEAPAATPVLPAPGRNQSFAVLLAASVIGGLLLALGLARVLKERTSSRLSRAMSSGPELDGSSWAEPAGSPSDAGVPKMIGGQYEIVRQIGEGGMGTVFEGVDRALGRRVAIKKMRDELRRNASDKARFLAEAKTVAALRHPGIVGIYGIVEDGRDVYLVFEHVDGRTVHDVMVSSGRLEPNRAALLVRAAAEALEYAHAQGVIHRDVKPSNMMLDAQGRVKLMDFGIARTVQDAVSRQAPTSTVLGTPSYMAPEQEEGRARRESDVYSLAVCAYEMLCGRLPFAGTGGVMALNKIKMAFTPLSRVLTGLPPALDLVFARAFHADPERRFRSPREFADGLAAALSPAARA